MKIMQMDRLIDRGDFSSSPTWEKLEAQIVSCMQELEWPPKSGKFLLHDQPGKKRGQGSGVKPIKDGFMLCLKRNGWRLQPALQIAVRKRPGALDAAYPVGEQFFGLEWETGNISSSHRSINRILLGIKKNILVGGALVLPTRTMYRYLTDRIGNYEELKPYFDLWQDYPVGDGLLVVIAIEHDGVSKDVPRIAKGTDGRALL